MKRTGAVVAGASALVNFHSKCKILGGVTEFFGKAFLCRFPPENLRKFPITPSLFSA